MKKLLIATIACLSFTATKAQHLPDTIRIKLSRAQVLKLDSAIQIAANNTDSKSLTNFLYSAVGPVFSQMQQQMVADKPKEVPKSDIKNTKKPEH